MLRVHCHVQLGNGRGMAHQTKPPLSACLQACSEPARHEDQAILELEHTLNVIATYVADLSLILVVSAPDRNMFGVGVQSGSPVLDRNIGRYPTQKQMHRR